MAASKSDLRDLNRAVRSLLLPIHPDWEGKVPELANTQLNALGVPTSEQPNAVARFVNEWENVGYPPREFRQLVETILKKCGGERGDALASGYFEAHKYLTERCELNFNAARTLLSASRLVIHLITKERMSCSQTARVLSAPLHGYTYNWEHVNALATKLRLPRPKLDASTATQVYNYDREEQSSRFADSNPKVELELVLGAASQLGFNSEARHSISRVMKPNFDPALMTLLHFLLTVCERYDHPPSVVYEFKPRGQALKFLQKQNLLYAAKESAALNVAKAATELNEHWAWGRTGPRRGDALALVFIFRGLEQMHYPARRELASWIRQWIVRMFARERGKFQWFKGVSKGEDAIALVKALMAQPTHSAGTIEQRLVDALTAVLHPDKEWSSRGRKDSVFASNTSRRKMGDCEYVSRNHTSIKAYEAHAGDITETYIDEHMATLSRVLNARSKDLEARGPAEAWNIEVTFIAHRFKGTKTKGERCISDFVVEFTIVDYGEMLERVQLKLDECEDGQAEIVGAVNDNIVGPLNEIWTPQSIRDSAIKFGQHAHQPISSKGV